MREYLFRAKAAENKGGYKIGEWVHGSLRRTTMDDFYIYDFGTDIRIKVDAETVGQYTGIKDRNGCMVYQMCRKAPCFSTGDIRHVRRICVSN